MLKKFYLIHKDSQTRFKQTDNLHAEKQTEQDYKYILEVAQNFINLNYNLNRRKQIVLRQIWKGIFSMYERNVFLLNSSSFTSLCYLLLLSHLIKFIRINVEVFQIYRFTGKDIHIIWKLTFSRLRENSVTSRNLTQEL